MSVVTKCRTDCNNQSIPRLGTLGVHESELLLNSCSVALNGVLHTKMLFLTLGFMFAWNVMLVLIAVEGVVLVMKTSRIWSSPFVEVNIILWTTLGKKEIALPSFICFSILSDFWEEVLLLLCVMQSLILAQLLFFFNLICWGR